MPGGLWFAIHAVPLLSEASPNVPRDTEGRVPRPLAGRAGRDGRESPDHREVDAMAFERCPEPARADAPSRIAKEAARAIVGANPDPRAVAAALSESLRPKTVAPSRLDPAVVDHRLGSSADST